MPRIDTYKVVCLQPGEHHRLPTIMPAGEPGEMLAMFCEVSGPASVSVPPLIADVAYRCPCGCDGVIVLPVAAQNKGGCWGYSIDAQGQPTLTPSVSQIGYPCKSHYFIREGKVQWC